MSDWKCPVSAKAQRTVNPIRAIVDKVVGGPQVERSDGKERIPLSLGDPTVFGNLPPSSILAEAAASAATSAKYNGYVNACGTQDARVAISAYHSTPECTFAPDDVVVASGCSGALELALTALLDPGTNLLVPAPGFPLYEVIANSHGAGVKPYRLDPNTGWECDLADIESQVDENTRGVLINNPSNPCGSVFSEAHLGDIIRLAAKLRLPIIADEVYGGMTFGDVEYVPLSLVSARLGGIAPIVSASGLAKQFLVPGWRVGWLTFYDTPGGAISEVKKGVMSLAQVVLGASHLAQAALPKVLTPETEEDKNAMAEFKKNLNGTLADQSKFTCDYLAKCPGLRVVPSSGAMYVMVEVLVSEFDGSFQDDVTFTKLLLDEENVFALPGSCFGAPNFFRVVYCATKEKLGEAYGRIEEFCNRHRKKD